MWRTRHRLFLEPGEVEALAAAARAASAAGPPHPRQLLLAAAAEALEAWAEPDGLLVRRAPACIRRRGARVHLLAAGREEGEGPRAEEGCSGASGGALPAGPARGIR